MVKQLVFGFFLGLITLLFFIQFDPWVKERMGNFITQELAELFQCDVTGTVESFSFSPELLRLKIYLFLQKLKEKMGGSGMHQQASFGFHGSITDGKVPLICGLPLKISTRIVG